MGKYRKFGKKNSISKGYIIFIAFIIGIIAMSVGYSYYSDTLTIRGIANAKYKIYQIEYELNGGTNPENAVTEFMIIDDIPLPVPTKSHYVFDGWYDNEDLSGTKITNTNQLDHEDVILYAKWRFSEGFPIVYSHEDEFVFTGDNHIDTGIYLYNDENWEKDYEIGFTIEEYTPSQQVNQAVFVNTKYENESIFFPGLVVRRYNSSNSIEVTQTINMGEREYKTINNYSLPCTIKVLRIDGIIYYSFNNEPLISVQDMNDFDQQFDVSVWFGAAPDVNGTPIRPLNGTLSNMYIRLGKYSPKKYTVTFNPNGGSVNERTREVNEFNVIGTLPVPTSSEGRAFEGWYTDLSFSERINDNTVVKENKTYYAKWTSLGSVYMDGVYYASLTTALENIQNNEGYTTIKLLEDIRDNVTIDAGKNIILDFQGHIISNNTSDAVIENKGNLKIIGGTFKSNGTNAVINNRAGLVEITNTRIISEGTKQAIYNEGGTLKISGNSYLASSSSIRAAVHNLKNGKLTITGGTIVSTNYSAVVNESGVMTIGTKDGNISTSSPIIQGKTYGVSSSANYSLYDGVLKGKTEAVNNVAKITNIEDNSQISNDTEIIDGVEYKTLYLELNN